jgi:hypothetical protein
MAIVGITLYNAIASRHMLLLIRISAYILPINQHLFSDSLPLYYL